MAANLYQIYLIKTTQTAINKYTNAYDDDNNNNNNNVLHANKLVRGTPKWLILLFAVYATRHVDLTPYGLLRIYVMTFESGFDAPRLGRRARCLSVRDK